MTGVHLLTSVSGTGGFSAWLQLSALFVYGLAGSYSVHCFLLGRSWELERRGELLLCRKKKKKKTPYTALQLPIGNRFCCFFFFFPFFNGTGPVVLKSVNTDVGAHVINLFHSFLLLPYFISFPVLPLSPLPSSFDISVEFLPFSSPR